MRHLALSLIDSGLLVLFDASQCRYSGGTTIAADACLEMRTGGFFTGNVVDNGLLDFSQDDVNPLTFIGDIRGSGRVSHDGSEQLTLSGNISGGIVVVQYGPGLLTLAGNNSNTGATIAAGGDLVLGSDEALSPASELMIYAGATLDLNGHNISIESLWGNGGTITDNSSRIRNDDSDL